MKPKEDKSFDLIVEMAEAIIYIKENREPALTDEHTSEHSQFVIQLLVHFIVRVIVATECPDENIEKMADLVRHQILACQKKYRPRRTTG